MSTTPQSRFQRLKNPFRVFAGAPIAGLAALLLLTTGCANPGLRRTTSDSLRQALVFHASFDHGPKADLAAGDPLLYSAPNMQPPRTGTPGLPSNQYVTIAPGAGRFGDALQFHRQVPDMIFFHGRNNMPYRDHHWNGTVSLWLRLTPDEDLAPGYTDPIQITTKAWNDAAFFVEFTKDEVPREFRHGAYADFPIWNPDNRKWEAIPLAEKPLIPVVRPPFRRDQWTHVVFTFSNFNTGRKDGISRLYLNGQPVGALAPREQTFTWDPDKARIMIGLSYIGFFDDLAIFDRALTEAEVARLYQLPQGVASLR